MQVLDFQLASEIYVYIYNINMLVDFLYMLELTSLYVNM